VALPTDQAGLLFYVDPMPQGGDQAELVAWMDRNLARLAAFLRRPEFPGLVLTQFEASSWEEFKAQNGMMVYVNAGVLGPQEGIYYYEESTWKKL